MDDRAPSRFQMIRPFPGGSRAGEHHGHLLLHDGGHVLLHGGIQQRHVDRKSPRPLVLDPAHFRPEFVRIHRAGPEGAKPPCPAHRHDELCPSAPHHASLNDRVSDAEHIAEQLRMMVRTGRTISRRKQPPCFHHVPQERTYLDLIMQQRKPMLRHATHTPNAVRWRSAFLLHFMPSQWLP